MAVVLWWEGRGVLAADHLGLYVAGSDKAHSGRGNFSEGIVFGLCNGSETPAVLRYACVSFALPARQAGPNLPSPYSSIAKSLAS